MSGVARAPRSVKYLAFQRQVRGGAGRGCEGGRRLPHAGGAEALVRGGGPRARGVLARRRRDVGLLLHGRLCRLPGNSQ